METLALSRVKTVSLEESIKSFLGADHVDGRQAYKLARRIWKALITQMPTLAYSTRGVIEALRNERYEVFEADGCPDPYHALEQSLSSQGLPATTADHLARPIVRFAMTNRALSPHQRHDSNASLWTFDTERYKSLQKSSIDAFLDSAAYLVAHLVRAPRQNL